MTLCLRNLLTIGLFAIRQFKISTNAMYCEYIRNVFAVFMLYIHSTKALDNEYRN